MWKTHGPVAVEEGARKSDEEGIRSASSTADRIIKAGREEPQEEQE
jgi:hypothetical protein